jgi:hypothetical protein
MTVTPDPTPGLFATLGQIARGFFRNAFGSDATVAYTAEYAWLANQMSHATMGFFVGVVWVLKVQEWGWPPWTMGLILIAPVVKDAVDYGLDTWRGSAAFKVDHRELILDWVTDDFYWGLGMVAAVVTLGLTEHVWAWRAATAVLGGGIALYLAFGVWVPRKRMFDFSRMPFNFVRLIKYPDPDAVLTADSQAELRAFQDAVAAHTKDTRDQRHYLVVGGRPIIRSGMAVSMGCEYVARRKGAYMISAVKILEDPERMRKHCEMAVAYKAEVFCLIIDDLNVHLPIPPETEGPKAHARMQSVPPEAPPAAQQEKKLLHFVDVFAYLRETFPYVSTVWVASADRHDPADQKRLKEWQAYIERLTGRPTTTVEVLEGPPRLLPDGRAAA